MKSSLAALVVFCAFALIGAAAFLIYSTRDRDDGNKKRLSPIQTSEKIDPVTCDLPARGEPAEKRNVVWSVWNDGPEKAAASPEKDIAFGLMLALKPEAFARKMNPDPEKAAELSRHLLETGINAFMKKSIFYFRSEENAQRMSRTVLLGDPRERETAFRCIAEADLRAAELINSVLADRERVNLFLQDKKIPLEPVSSGTRR